MVIGGCIAEADGVAGERGEIGKQAAPAVHRLAVVGALAAALAAAAGETWAAATGEGLAAAAAGRS